MGVPSTGEHIFDENIGNQSSGKGKQSKTWSTSECKGKSKEHNGKSKGPKAQSKVKNIENWYLRSSKRDIRHKFGNSGISANGTRLCH